MTFMPPLHLAWNKLLQNHSKVQDDGVIERKRETEKVCDKVILRLLNSDTKGDNSRIFYPAF